MSPMRSKGPWVLGGLALVGALAGLGAAARGVATDLATPRDLHAVEHATSGECQRCHPSQFESWHRTYHRTMTREATPADVLGDFDNARFRYGGIEARMTRTDAGGFEMSFYGPEGLLSRAEVVRTVGSHRYQQYLASDGDVLFRLPIAWHVEEGRWFHMNGAFLTPDPPAPPEGGRIALEDYQRHVTRWNDNCIFCHNVSPDPGWHETEARFDSDVAELGIACEACHGPADEHARVNANPLRRYTLHLGEGPDPTIVNPARLDPARSAEICGRCHGQRITDDLSRFLERGDPYVPGDRLTDYSRPLARETSLGGERGVFAARFWPDGTARLTAYEYQGLLQSPCRSMTCTDCHGMHEGDPRGQIRPAREGDDACTSCHDAPDAGAHARHDGVACVDCHMPRIVYGLVGVFRSHRVEVPNVITQTDRPDACSLCHADRSPTWLRAGYARLWGEEAPDAEAETLPRVRRDLMAGDPVERSVAASALGRADDLKDRPGRIGFLLDTMLEDPYPAVRRVAWRSLLALSPRITRDTGPGFVPTGSRGEREAWIRRARGLVRAHPPPPELTAELRARAASVAIEIGE